MPTGVPDLVLDLGMAKVDGFEAESLTRAGADDGVEVTIAAEAAMRRLLEGARPDATSGVRSRRECPR